jgi:hypothetical protein
MNKNITVETIQIGQMIRLNDTSAIGVIDFKYIEDDKTILGICWLCGGKNSRGYYFSTERHGISGWIDIDLKRFTYLYIIPKAKWNFYKKIFFE